MAGGKFAGGLGTKLDPFLIEDAHDLNAMRYYKGTYHYKIIKDINMNVPPYNLGRGWIPIYGFNSKIDGQGHKVSGLRIWSKGDHVGFIVSSGLYMEIVNTHFDDVYFEFDTEEDSSSKIFTFFGYIGNRKNDASSFSTSPIRGCSLIGEFSINSSSIKRTSLISQEIVGAISGNTAVNYNYYFDDLYIDIINSGKTPIGIYGKTIESNSSRMTNNMYVRRNILKCEGLFNDISLGANGRFYISDIYLVEEEGKEYDGLNYLKSNIRDLEYLSDIKNMRAFLDISHEGRLTWYLPGNTHIRMIDYSRNKFLIGAGQDLYTHNNEEGLIKLQSSEILPEIFSEHGVDYIESIPVDAWEQIKKINKEVAVHCYVEKIPGKSIFSKEEKMKFEKNENNKSVMRTVISFDDHNNDIFKIFVPTEIEERSPDEPDESPEGGDGVTENNPDNTDENENMEVL